MVRGWQRFTTGPVTITRMEGSHLWPLQREPKAEWLRAIAEAL